MVNAFWLNHNLEQTKAISSISKLPEHHRVFNVTNDRDTAAKAAAQNGSWLLVGNKNPAASSPEYLGTHSIRFYNDQ
ncbi:hypothetical protein ACFQO4_00495 [Saliphagus sp. GCM10025334]